MRSRFHSKLFILPAVGLAAILIFGACSTPDSTGTPAEPQVIPTALLAATQPVQPETSAPGTVAAATQAATGTAAPQPSPDQTQTPGGQDTGGAGGEPGAEQPPAPDFDQAPRVFPRSESLGLELVVEGLSQPVGLVNAGDGSGRLFVLEQTGKIRVIQDGEVLEAAFLDIEEKVVVGSEQGLLGLAFHPDYEQNGFFFINYTDTNGDSVVARYRVSEDPNLADAGSEARLVFIDQPYANHNGGGVVFGPDGYLYLSFGDGGSGGDPQGNAQSLDTLLGKILRIDVTGGDPYVIPPDNPFNSAGQQPEIWAYGLRNPWRFSFDRQTGDLYIADVGQNMWEEINFVPAGTPGGGNFGWDYLEGTHLFEDEPPAGAVLVGPVYEYNHSQGCSVTGGVVYRGEVLDDWQGIYLFGDYCSGLLWGLLRDENDQWQAQVLMETGLRITSFGEDESGEVYLVDHRGGIYRLAGAAPAQGQIP